MKKKFNNINHYYIQKNNILIYINIEMKKIFIYNIFIYLLQFYKYYNNTHHYQY